MSGLFKPSLVIQEAAEDEWFSQPFPSKVSLPLSPHGSLGLFGSPLAEYWWCWVPAWKLFIIPTVTEHCHMPSTMTGTEDAEREGDKERPYLRRLN